MEIILQIPPQPLTLNEARSMTVLGMDFQNAIITEARDGKLPAQIRFTENDPFPWGQLLQKLAVLWQLSQNHIKGFPLKKQTSPADCRFTAPSRRKRLLERFKTARIGRIHLCFF